MACALCLEKEANKKNTHYLTDGIIRSCLNLEGSQDREKGYYFKISNDSSEVKFNFQRETSIDIVETSLGREVKDEEIEEAKKNPFTVDYIFCSECEKLFSEIESKFMVEILPALREADVSNIDRKTFGNAKLLRLFVLLQIWRTSICDGLYKINPEVQENLRQILLTHNESKIESINQYPLIVSYLQTLGDDSKKYTYNFVGVLESINPNIILMNDFIIQFYESEELMKYFEFYGLNTPSFKEFVNIKESEFIIHILGDKERQSFLDNLRKQEFVDSYSARYKQDFVKTWKFTYGENPTEDIIDEYLKVLTHHDGDEVPASKYSKEWVIDITMKFIMDRKK
jgi:hypothetical protein